MIDENTTSLDALSADSDRYQHYEEAKQHQSDGEFVEAGDYYTLAAYTRLGEGHVTIEPFEDQQSDATWGLCNLLSAVMCYRLSSESDRAINRAEQGVLIATDIRDYVSVYEPQRGMMNEYVGDFRLLGGLENFDEAYQAAEEAYAETDNDIGWQAEPESEMNMTIFLRLAKAADHEIERTKKAAIKTESLVERIQYKRKNYPEIIDDVIEAGGW